MFKYIAYNFRFYTLCFIFICSCDTLVTRRAEELYNGELSGVWRGGYIVSKIMGFGGLSRNCFNVTSK